MSEPVILLEKRDNIAIITINRPKVHNALNAEVFKLLGETYDALEQDDSVRAVIVTGSGAKAFVAGTDISMMAAMNDMDEATAKAQGLEWDAVFERAHSMSKPVIAAINGVAFGGGLELALACDFRIAVPHSRFAFPEVSLGIIPGSGGTQRLPRLIGQSRAKRIIFTAEQIDATTALSYGLVDQVVAPDELMGVCMDLAIKIARNPAISISLAKKVTNAASENRLEDGLELEATSFAHAFVGDERKKRMAAFVSGGKK